MRPKARLPIFLLTLHRRAPNFGRQAARVSAAGFRSCAAILYGLENCRVAVPAAGLT